LYISMKDKSDKSRKFLKTRNNFHGENVFDVIDGILSKFDNVVQTRLKKLLSQQTVAEVNVKKLLGIGSSGNKKGSGSTPVPDNWEDQAEKDPEVLSQIPDVKYEFTESTKWWKEAGEASATDKISFGKMLERDKETSDSPMEIFERKSTGKKTLFLPTSIPPNNDVKIAMGCLINIARLTGLDLAECGKEDETTDFYNILKAMKDTLQAVQNCLVSDKIKHLDNIPSKYRIGWDFVVWQTFKMRSKLKDGLDLLKQTKQEKITPDTTLAWLNKSSVKYVNRITELVKLACKNVSSKLAEPVTFFKSKIYVTEKIAGKKPNGACMHECELSILMNDFETRTEHISKMYDSMQWKNATVDGLQALYTSMTETKKSAECKQILDTISSRTPLLLITSGKGKKTETKIVKGASLHDKLQNINGGNNVRVIAKVMWSPLTTITSDSFASHVLQAVKLTVTSQKEKATEKNKELAAKFTAEFLDTISPKQEIGDLAIQTYLSLIDDNRDVPSWKATFGL